MNFKKYDDPKKAKRLWEAYKPFLLSRGLIKAAENIFDETNSVDALDVKLDCLMVEDVGRRIAKSSCRDTKYDDEQTKEPYYSIGVRCLEDGYRTT